MLPIPLILIAAAGGAYFWWSQSGDAPAPPDAGQNFTTEQILDEIQEGLLRAREELQLVEDKLPPLHAVTVVLKAVRGTSADGSVSLQVVSGRSSAASSQTHSLRIQLVPPPPPPARFAIEARPRLFAAKDIADAIISSYKGILASRHPELVAGFVIELAFSLRQSAGASLGFDVAAARVGSEVGSSNDDLHRIMLEYRREPEPKWG